MTTTLTQALFTLYSGGGRIETLRSLVMPLTVILIDGQNPASTQLNSAQLKARLDKVALPN